MVNESGPKPIVEPVNQFRQSARGLWEREKGSGLKNMRLGVVEVVVVLLAHQRVQVLLVSLVAVDLGGATVIGD